MPAGHIGHPAEPTRDTPLEPLELSALGAEPLDWRFRAFPADGPGVRFDEVFEQGWNALTDFRLPVMVLLESAVDQNVDALAAFCSTHGVDLAPHVKTPLAPALFERQRRAGAWAATVATVDQLRVVRSWGVRRAILANEVVDAAALAWLAREARDPTFELYLFVDSVAVIDRLSAALATEARRSAVQPVRVLVEVGHAGGRCGCRTLDAALEVAAAARAASHMVVSGVAAYEGGLGNDGSTATLSAVDSFVDFIRAAANALDDAGHFSDASEIIVSAGGSGFFDRVVTGLGQPWRLSKPPRIVLRSGAYIAHDAGHYRRLSPLDGRSEGAPALRNALEVWAAVISRPEDNLAIAGFGKRDAPCDLELPVPFAVVRPGEAPRETALPTVTALGDHHAFLEVPSACELSVGDLVGAHIVHPCTAFDKWRAIPMVDDDYRVLEAVRILL